MGRGAGSLLHGTITSVKSLNRMSGVRCGQRHTQPPRQGARRGDARGFTTTPPRVPGGSDDDPKQHHRLKRRPVGTTIRPRRHATTAARCGPTRTLHSTILTSNTCTNGAGCDFGTDAPHARLFARGCGVGSSFPNVAGRKTNLALSACDASICSASTTHRHRRRRPLASLSTIRVNQVSRAASPRNVESLRTHARTLPARCPRRRHRRKRRVPRETGAGCTRGPLAAHRRPAFHQPSKRQNIRWPLNDGGGTAAWRAPEKWNVPLAPDHVARGFPAGIRPAVRPGLLFLPAVRQALA